MTGETALRVVLAVVMVVQTAVSGYFIRRAGADAALLRNRQAEMWLTSALVSTYVAYGAGVIVFLIAPERLGWSAVDLSLGWRWVGAIPLLLGSALFVRGLADLGASLTISPSTKDEHQLVTDGSYRWMRHPVYSALFAQTIGVALMTASWFVGLCGAGFCALMAYRTGAEEENLVAEFGDRYREYQRQVGMFIPRLRRPR